jgi:hypothetical protein
MGAALCGLGAGIIAIIIRVPDVVIEIDVIII